MEFVLLATAFVVGIAVGIILSPIFYRGSLRRGVLKISLQGSLPENEGRKYHFTSLVKELERLDNGYSRIKILSVSGNSDYYNRAAEEFIGELVKTNDVEWETNERN